MFLIWEKEDEVSIWYIQKSPHQCPPKDRTLQSPYLVGLVNRLSAPPQLLGCLSGQTFLWIFGSSPTYETFPQPPANIEHVEAFVHVGRQFLSWNLLDRLDDLVSHHVATIGLGFECSDDSHVEGVHYRCSVGRQVNDFMKCWTDRALHHELISYPRVQFCALLSAGLGPTCSTSSTDCLGHCVTMHNLLEKRDFSKNPTVKQPRRGLIKRNLLTRNDCME